MEFIFVLGCAVLLALLFAVLQLYEWLRHKADLARELVREKRLANDAKEVAPEQKG